MTNQYVIKFHHLYYNQYPGTYHEDINLASHFIHPDVAKQIIIDKKLPLACKVYQINVVENEVK